MATEKDVTKITLKSSDNESFEVEREVIKLSTTISTVLQDLGMDGDCGEFEENEPIPLEDVNGGILRKVIQWCTYHKDDPVPASDSEREERRMDDIPPWDVEFLKVDQGTLFALLLAADYLGIQVLQDYICKTIANMIKGKSAEEIVKMLTYKHDFTPEEEELLRKEDAWFGI